MLTRTIIRATALVIFIVLRCSCLAQFQQFRHLTSEDGLSQSEIYAFLEDSQGFIWIGTVDGLNRYDGYDITIFNTDKDNPNAISHNTIRCLAEDNDGRIWIGTDDGLSLYDSKTEIIHQIELEGIDNNRLTINAVVIKDNNLFLGTSKGLIIAQLPSSNLSQINVHPMLVQLEDGKSSYAVVACELGNQGKLWVTTTDGLYHYSAKSGNDQTLIKDLDLTSTLPDIRNLKEDQYGNLWIVSHDNGFARYNPSSGILKQFRKNNSNKSISSNKISSVAIDLNGDLWIGTHDMGLMLLNNQYLNAENPRFQFITNDPYNDRSLISNLVYSLYVSKQNLLWIGTIGSGVSIYDPNRKPFQYYSLRNSNSTSSYSTNFIRAVYADEKDNLWIGTHNNGLFFFDRNAMQKVNKIGMGTESIFHLNNGGNGNLLVCSAQGLSLIRKTNNSVKVLDNLTIGPSFFVTQPRDGIFWIASLHGLKKCNIVDDRISIAQAYSTETNPALSFNNCRVLYFDQETNALYVGTEGGGLNIMHFDATGSISHSEILMHNASPNSLSNNYIRSIIKHSDGAVYIGTYEGLNRMYKESNGDYAFQSYTTTDGLPNHTIQSLIEDNDGNLWIGTNQGLCKFDPTSGKFTPYTSNDGLQSDEFSEHTIYKTSQNEIIIGGINGFNTFFPDQILSDDHKPNTTITDFYLFNKKIGVGAEVAKGVPSPLHKGISITDTILLQPDQNSIGFDFSAMTFTAPEKVQYAYKLDGLDENWNYTNADNRNANFTNLNYGEYIFNVKATNNDGIWESSPQQLFVKIKTPFYLTTVAFVLYGIMAVLAFIFFTNYSILRYTTKNKIILENQHNKKVRELEELRTRFFINISHDLRTPLTLISGPLDVIVQHKDIPKDVNNLLALIQRNVRKLRDMTEQLLDISKIESGTLNPKFQNLNISNFIKQEISYFENAFSSKRIELDFQSEVTHCEISFDPDMISKVIFNLLSNALKYTDSGKVIVSISKEVNESIDHQSENDQPNYICISVQDSGEGIKDADVDKVFERFYQGKDQNKKGYGVGLSHTKDLIEAHNGSISVESQLGKGTTFSFYLPDIQIAIDTATNALPIIEKPKILIPEDRPGQDTDVQEGNKVQRLLIVEDNTDLRNFIISSLSSTYEILEAEDGAAGLDIATREFPDLIVSDVMMPNMDGMEFCKEVKSNIKTSHIPVILLTAKVDREAKYQGLEIGADDYIAKPFEMDYLLLKIRNLLQNRARLRKLFQGSLQLDPAKVTVTSIDEEFLSNLMAEIEKGIPDANFSISTLERQLGMSHSSFYNKIKSLTGQSGKELVVSVRMKRAKQILEDTANIRVSEVAYMVGFTDPKYFSKRFKEYFGSSPSEMSKK